MKGFYLIYTGEKTNFIIYDTFKSIYKNFGLIAIKIEEI